MTERMLRWVSWPIVVAIDFIAGLGLAADKPSAGKLQEKTKSASAKAAPVLKPGESAAHGLRQDDVEALRSLLRNAVADKAVPGVALLLARKGEVVFKEAFGDIKTDEPVQMASDTKPVAATVVMAVVDQGKLCLDDSLTKFVPQFKGTKVEKATVRPLLRGGVMGIGTPLLVMYGLGGLLVLLGVGTFLFQAGCALADTPERGYFRSLPIYGATVAVCLPLTIVLIWFAGTYDTDPSATFGAMRITGLIVSLVLTWLLSAGIYSLLLAASLKKGLAIAGVELLLMVLLAALVSAVVLVVLAVVQILMRPPPARSFHAPLPIVRAADRTAAP